ncbi:MAG: hypothetical protein AAFQ22_08890, partial [Pseudomonadota bacterium]
MTKINAQRISNFFYSHAFANLPKSPFFQLQHPAYFHQLPRFAFDLLLKPSRKLFLCFILRFCHGLIL